MFNLIITIISIALVAVLAIATIYYGGTAFTQGSAKAAASTLVAHGQQITAANVLYANAHGGASASGDATALDTALVSEYLTSLPDSPNAGAYAVTTAGMVYAVVPSTDSKVCDAVNVSLDPNAAANRTLADDAALATAGQYGCAIMTATALPGAVAGDRVFFYKG